MCFLSMVAGGGVAQVHAGIFDFRHAAGQRFLRVFQDALAVDGGVSAQFLGLGLRGGQNFHGALLAALDDFLLTDQCAGALLGLLDDTLGLDAGIFHDLLAVVDDFFTFPHFVGHIVAHLVNDVAHTVDVHHALGGGERHSRAGLQGFFHQIQQFFYVHTCSSFS